MRATVATSAGFVVAGTTDTGLDVQTRIEICVRNLLQVSDPEHVDIWLQPEYDSDRAADRFKLDTIVVKFNSRKRSCPGVWFGNQITLNLFHLVFHQRGQRVSRFGILGKGKMDRLLYSGQWLKNKVVLQLHRSSRFCATSARLLVN